MNRVFITGNLVRDPELRTTQSGVSVCTFTVAVNRRKQEGKQEADFFRVSAWRQLGENCNRFLAKGRKVGVAGTLTLQTYTANDGQQRASLEVQADEVEFLTPATQQATHQADQKAGFVQVDEADLPF